MYCKAYLFYIDHMFMFALIPTILMWSYCKLRSCIKNRGVRQVTALLFNQIKNELKGKEQGDGISEHEIMTKYTQMDE